MAISLVKSNILAATPIQSSTAPRTKAGLKQAPSSTDTVKISAAAKSLQSKTAAPAQVVQAAAAGDLQAKAQLAKPAASSSVKK
jgi:hypothetical protein